MKNTKTLFFALAMIGTLTSPLIGLAATSTTTIQAQIDLITQLAKQLGDLQTQAKNLQQQTKEVKTEVRTATEALVESLHEGSTGDQVKILQTILASDSSIFPEGNITGFFGKLTAQAVKRFQKKNSIEIVGNVGPKTRAKLNEFLKENPVTFESGNEQKASGMTSSTTPGVAHQGQERRLCAIVPPGHLIAPGWLRKHNDEKPIVPPCQILPPGIIKQSGTTTLDVIPPIISAINTSVSSTTATVTWTTGESATSKAYYSTATPVDLSSALTVIDNSLMTSHSLALNS